MVFNQYNLILSYLSLMSLMSFPGWQKVIIVAAVDCSQKHNTDLCRTYNIPSYPSMVVSTTLKKKRGVINIPNYPSMVVRIILEKGGGE